METIHTTKHREKSDIIETLKHPLIAIIVSFILTTIIGGYIHALPSREKQQGCNKK